MDGQFVASGHGLFAFLRRKAAEIEGIQVSPRPPKNTVLSKFGMGKKSRSSRQIEDIAGISKVQARSLDRSYIEKWVRELNLDSQWQSARRMAGFEY